MLKSHVKTELKIWGVSIELFQSMMNEGLLITDQNYEQHISLIKGSVGANAVIKWVGETSEGKHHGSYALYEALVNNEWDVAEIYREDHDDTQDR